MIPTSYDETLKPLHLYLTRCDDDERTDNARHACSNLARSCESIVGLPPKLCVNHYNSIATVLQICTTLRIPCKQMLLFKLRTPCRPLCIILPPRNVFRPVWTCLCIAKVNRKATTRNYYDKVPHPSSKPKGESHNSITAPAWPLCEFLPSVSCVSKQPCDKRQ